MGIIHILASEQCNWLQCKSALSIMIRLFLVNAEYRDFTVLCAGLLSGPGNQPAITQL